MRLVIVSLFALLGLGLHAQDFDGKGAFSVTDATKLQKMEQMIWAQAAKPLRIPCGTQIVVMEDALWAQKRVEIESYGRSPIAVLREWFGARAKAREEALAAFYGASDLEGLRVRVGEAGFTAYAEWDTFMRALSGALSASQKR